MKIAWCFSSSQNATVDQAGYIKKNVSNITYQSFFHSYVNSLPGRVHDLKKCYQNITYQLPVIFHHGPVIDEKIQRLAQSSIKKKPAGRWNPRLRWSQCSLPPVYSQSYSLVGKKKTSSPNFKKQCCAPVHTIHAYINIHIYIYYYVYIYIHSISIVIHIYI